MKKNIIKQSLVAFALVAAVGTTTFAGTEVDVNAKTKSTKEAKNGVVVTMENFINADSTRAYLKELDQSKNKVNMIRHNRKFPNTDTQDVIRMNKDTLYSKIILDVKGGATISSKAYDGFQNIMVLDTKHNEIKTLMGEGTVKVDETMLTEGQHAFIIVRTGLDRTLPEKEMFDKAYKAQDNISITYKSSEPFVPVTKFDFSTLDKIKYGILGRFVTHPMKDVVKKGFGTEETRDPDAARVVVAIGWGGMTGKNAVYSSFNSKKERSTYTLDKPDLNYDKGGFFSVTIYNGDGYIATMNYAINSGSMEPNKDGTYTITFLASGEPEKEGDKNVVRTPRGKVWTGILRAYYPKDKNETFKWADAHTAKMTKEFMSK